MRRLIRDSVPVVIEILIGAGVFALPVSKAAAETCFVTALVCWLLNKIISRSLPATDPKIALLYGVFFGFSLASLAWIQPRFLSEGIQGIFKWSKYLGVFFMCLEIYASPKKQLRLFWVFIASMLIVSLDGFYQLYSGKDIFFGRPLDPGRIIRMKGSFGAPNLLAGFLLFALPLSVLCAYKARSWLRILFGASFLTFLAAFFLTYSRGAFYAIVLSLFFNMLVVKKIKTALMTTACLALLVMAVPSLRYNFVKTIEQKDITIVERGEYWEVAFKMIKEHPLRGVGLNTYHAQFPAYATNPDVRQAYPHNSYLQMASEIGLPGFLVFMLAILYVLGRSVKRPDLRTDPAIITLRIALSAFLMQAFFDTNFYALQTASLFWIFWGIFGASVLSRPSTLEPGTPKSS